MRRMSSASEVLSRHLVWDNHGCMPLRPFDETFLPQLSRYKAVGVNVVAINIGFGEQSIEDHVRQLAHFRRWLSLHEDEYVIVDSVQSIERAQASGKLAVSFDMEGANAIADQPSLLQLYYDLGVRWMLMAYNKNNLVGGGCHDEDPGLSAYGRQVLDEMARVGMVACCTHTGYRTALDVMAYSSKPVIFSHSNPRAVYDHPRNIPDELMRACASTGGVVGLNGIGPFLGRNDNSTDAFVRHLDYAVELIGPQHVGLGLDYVFDTAELDDYIAKMKGTFPPGMGYENGVRMVAPEQLESIVARLMTLGYSDADLQSILGGNLLRVATQVWQ